MCVEHTGFNEGDELFRKGHDVQGTARRELGDEHGSVGAVIREALLCRGVWVEVADAAVTRREDDGHATTAYARANVSTPLLTHEPWKRDLPRAANSWQTRVA